MTDPDPEDDGIACWWCPICETLTLLDRAMRGECALGKRPENCPAVALARRLGASAEQGG
jgi:hypothetical protein